MNGMRPRERTPPRAHCGLPASGCSCCFFCRESSLSRLSLAIPSLTSGASPMSPLRQTLFRPAIHPPRRVLPFLVFAILCHTACFCLLPLDLGHFLEGHHLLSLSSSSSASSSVVLRPRILAPTVLVTCRFLGSPCTHRIRASGNGVQVLPVHSKV